MRLGLGLLIAALAASLSGNLRAAPMYHITDLGVLSTGGLQFSEAYGLNASNQVVGISGSHAFLWQNGVMTDLDPQIGNSGTSFARGINASGQIVGKFNAPVGGQHAFILQPGGGGMTDIGLFPGGTGNSFATAINDAGVVVGESDSGFSDGRPRDRAFTWQAGLMTDPSATLSNDISLEVAQGVNASGQIVGRGSQTNLPPRGFLLDTNGTLAWLNSTGGLDSWAFGLNDSGDAVGHMYDSVGPNRAALWRNGVATELGGLTTGGSRALDINNADQVVGWSNVGGANTNAFLWLEGEGMLNLNSLLINPAGWILQEATAINESGVIVGFGLHDNVTRGFILIPQAAGAPEPATLVLFGAGLLMLAGLRSRRHTSP